MAKPPGDDLLGSLSDRALIAGGIAVALLVARTLSLRGQPLNAGDAATAVDDAEKLLREIEKRYVGKPADGP